MRTRRLMLTAALVSLAPLVSHAQQPALSPERQEAIAEVSRLMNDPVKFVLHYRTELALTDAQVSELEKLAAALRDSTAARTAVASQQAAQMIPSLTGLNNAMEWSGPIDESAIRDALCRQSAVTASMLLANARDRRTVGALLTADQRLELPKVHMRELMKAARGEGR